MSQRRRPTLRLGLTLGISLVLVLLAFRNVQLRDLLAALGRLDPGYLALAVGLYFVDLGLRSLRWRLLVARSAPVAIRHLYIGLIVGYAANNLLPARVGEIARVLAVGRLTGVRPASLLGTIVVERVLDGITVVTLLALLLPLLPAADWVRPVTIAGGLFFGAFAVGLVVAARFRDLAVRLLAALLKPLPRPLQERGQAIATAGLEGVAGSLAAGASPATVLLSIAIWSVGALIYLTVGVAFGVHLPIWWWVIAMGLTNLATAVPLAPAGLGAFELVLIEVLQLAGIPEAVAASLTLTLHGVMVVPVVVAGFACVWYWGLSLRPSGTVLPLPTSRVALASAGRREERE